MGTRRGLLYPTVVMMAIVGLVMMGEEEEGVEASSRLVGVPKLGLVYHRGPILDHTIKLFLTYYGDFPPSDKAAIQSFLSSLSPISPLSPRGSGSSSIVTSVAHWWSLTRPFGVSQIVELQKVQVDHYSLGKRLRSDDVESLARISSEKSGLFLLLTAPDVVVEGFCMHTCGRHSSYSGSLLYAWVGNPGSQCPGFCAWPFARPEYGPQLDSPNLRPPNGLGVDGVIMNLAKVLVGATTNPFGTGYYNEESGLNAVSACVGIFGPGAYPGYPGRLLKDPSTGASYNVEGINGYKFLLPWVWSPTSEACIGYATPSSQYDPIV